MGASLQYRQPCAHMEKELLPGFVTYFQEVHMLVAKVKAMNQWMECETCHLGGRPPGMGGRAELVEGRSLGMLTSSRALAGPFPAYGRGVEDLQQSCRGWVLGDD